MSTAAAQRVLDLAFGKLHRTPRLAGLEPCQPIEDQRDVELIFEEEWQTNEQSNFKRLEHVDRCVSFWQRSCERGNAQDESFNGRLYVCGVGKTVG